MAAHPVFVIVGAGLAGVRAAEALRDNGFDGQTVLIGAEAHLPYDRIALSKEFLAAKTSPVARHYGEADRRLTLPDFTVHDRGWFDDHGIEIRLGVGAVEIDRAARSVTLADGTSVRYDKLLLATGARARRLDIAGHDADGVHHLRTVDDAGALDAALVPGSSLAVLGSGWIGLEVAASARQRGVEVTVVGRSALPLLSALGPELGEVFAGLHREHGVRLRSSARVREITTAGGRATGLALDDGTRVVADSVLVAVGAVADADVAARAGLQTGDGIAVDASLRTADPDIYAVGDAAAVANPLLGRRIRTGHWADARKQPAVAAAGMLGAPGRYAELPYFFTDQFELGVEYVGHAPSYARVVFRGEPAGREFLAFWLDDCDRVRAAMSVNVWDVIDDLKQLVRAGIGGHAVDPARLIDPRRPLTELLTA